MSLLLDALQRSEQRPLFLEVNPLAGLNPKDSDLPILARMAGVSYTELIRRIMASATARTAARQP